MYSLIVMTAMAGSGDATAFHGRSVSYSCHGCHGTVVVASCHGCGGCTGCMGSSCSGGVFGSRRATRTSCHGCFGSSCMGSSCHGCFGSSAVPTGVMHFEGEVIGMPSTGTVKLETDDKDAANIRIELPPGAKLYVDGTLVETVNGHFHTPPLAKNKTFFYDMKCELMVNGKSVTEEKRVMVRGGETTFERFTMNAVASK